MAKYKEQWPNPINPIVIGYYDNENGKRIPKAPGNPDYRDVLAWLDLGNLPDPAYTPLEIEQYIAARKKEDDISSARQTYNLAAMSVSEREDFIDSQISGATTPAQIRDAIAEALKKIIVYI